MSIAQLMLIQKQCKLTDMELARFNQMSINQASYQNGRTAKDMRIHHDKIKSLVSGGYLKSAGFCYTNGGKIREDLFIINATA